MSVERRDPRTIAIVGGEPDDVRRFIESDYKIRSGLCPNDGSLMVEIDGMQQCRKCVFATNVLAEKGTAQ